MQLYMRTIIIRDPGELKAHDNLTTMEMLNSMQNTNMQNYNKNSWKVMNESEFGEVRDT